MTESEYIHVPLSPDEFAVRLSQLEDDHGLRRLWRDYSIAEVSNSNAIEYAHIRHLYWAMNIRERRVMLTTVLYQKGVYWQQYSIFHQLYRKYNELYISDLNLFLENFRT